jgi:hypothetical protein
MDEIPSCLRGVSLLELYQMEIDVLTDHMEFCSKKLSNDRHMLTISEIESYHETISTNKNGIKTLTTLIRNYKNSLIMEPYRIRCIQKKINIEIREKVPLIN